MPCQQTVFAFCPEETRSGFQKRVLFSTFIILLLVPASYVILEDIKALLGQTEGRENPGAMEGATWGSRGGLGEPPGETGVA